MKLTSCTIVALVLAIAWNTIAAGQELTEAQRKSGLIQLITNAGLDTGGKAPAEFADDLLSNQKYNLAFISDPEEVNGGPLTAIVGPLEAKSYDVLIQCFRVQGDLEQAQSLSLGAVGPTLKVEELDVGKDPTDESKVLPVCGSSVERFSGQVNQQAGTDGIVRQPLSSDLKLFSYTKETLDLAGPIDPTRPGDPADPALPFRPALVIYIMPK